jgi:hypothetical protein
VLGEEAVIADQKEVMAKLTKLFAAITRRFCSLGTERGMRDACLVD